MDAQFIIIPGFTHYRINRETKEVQSNRQSGKWKTIKVHSCGCYRLVSDKRNAYNATPNRLLYAAQRGINPASIRSDLYLAILLGIAIHGFRSSKDK